MNQFALCFDDGNAFLTERNLNSFKINEWREALLSEYFSIMEYEKLLHYFAVSVFKSQNGFSSASSPKFLASLEAAIYDVLSDEANRGKANILMSSAISGLSGTIASTWNMEPFIVSGFLNLIILSIMKIGVDAWCKYYKSKTNKWDIDSYPSNL